MYGYGFRPNNKMFGGGGATLSYYLDDYGTPVVWYEMVKRFSAYTGPCIRVRRSSDNAEQNINFVDDLLDTTSLLSFVGAGNGFVTTFYTQVGTANVTNATASQQPQIVSSGALITRNGFVSIKYDGSNDNLTKSGATINTTNVSYYSVAQCDVSSGAGCIHSQRLTNNNTIRTFIDRGLDNLSMQINDISGVVFTVYNPPQKNDSNIRIFSNYVNSANFMSTFQNGTAGTTNTYTGTIINDGLRLGSQYLASYLNGSINCFGAYNTDNSANRVAIETILNNYYNIY